MGVLVKHHCTPAAAAMLNAGTVYAMNRHSLCPSMLSPAMKASEGHISNRDLGDTRTPRRENGRAVRRSLGREEVR